MSRTIRTIRKGYKPKTFVKGGDSWNDKSGWLSKRKTKPFAKNPSFRKDKPEFSDVVFNGWMKRVSKFAKLLSRNTNRAIKKGKRQQLNKELKKELNEDIS